MKIRPLFQSDYGKHFCGPTCISMAIRYYKKYENPSKIFSKIKEIRKKTKQHLDEKRKGFTYIDEHPDVLKELGFKSKRIKKSDLRKKINDHIRKNEPLIVNTKNYGGHFIVIKNCKNDKIFLNDPKKGEQFIDISKFMKRVKSDFDYNAIAVYK